MYDGVFLKAKYPNGIDSTRRNWRHEEGSILMLRYLIKKNDIQLTDYGLTTNTELYDDMKFIEEIINGTPEPLRVGRPKHKF